MVELRDMQPEDKEKVRAWRNLSEVAKYMYTDQHITVKEHAKWFQRILNDPSCHYWIIVCAGIDVGLANIYNLDRRHQRCYWAFYVADSNTRGKGVGSFVEYFVLRHVFDRLGLEKLCCEVLDFNQAVINMHKKFGFQQEGHFRKHIIKGDQVFDVIALAMLREEWLLKKPELEERLHKKGLL